MRLLSALLGWVALMLAGFVWLLSLREAPGSRDAIQKVSTLLAMGGGVFVAVHLLFFKLPDLVWARGSPSQQRRDAIYKRGRLYNPRYRPGSGRNDGSVLVVVLAVLAAVAALVLQVQLTARTRLHAQQTELRRASLVRAATTAARSALQRLADDRETLFDSRDEPWAKREEIRTPEGIDTIVNVIDENRFFDLNNLARRTDSSVRSVEEVVLNLLNGSGQFDGGNRVRALQDWIDADDNGAHESIIYRDRKPPFTCPNRPLVSWNELFDVDGWRREQFVRRGPSAMHGIFEANLSECVTIIPAKHDRVVPVNVNTASRDVLMGVLGLEQDVLANAILSMRKIQPIQTIDAVQQLMEPALFAQVSPYLSVRSLFFRIDAQAFAEGSSARIRAIASRDADGRVEIVQWML